MLEQSALLVINNHGEEEFIYHINNGHVDTLGVEICYKLHEPEYFYEANKSDWLDYFIHNFSEKRFQKQKHFPKDFCDIAFVYNIIFSKECIVVDFYERLGSVEEWCKWEKKRIFQTDMLTGFKSRLKVLCVEND